MFLRHNNLIFRYGGVMFAVVLSTATIKHINVLTEKIRKGLSGGYLNNSANLTFSIGVAIHHVEKHKNLHKNSVNDVIKQADQALNLAKLMGELLHNLG